jgi:hypothetical protein
MKALNKPLEDNALPLMTVTDGAQTARYRTVAAHFEDTTTLFPTSVSGRAAEGSGSAETS